MVASAANADLSHPALDLNAADSNPNVAGSSFQLAQMHNSHLNLDYILPDMAFPQESDNPKHPGNFAFSDMNMFQKPAPGPPAGKLSFPEVVGHQAYQTPNSGALLRPFHTKNISISSHLDMFSLGDSYGKFEMNQPLHNGPSQVPQPAFTSKAESTPKKENVTTPIAPRIPHLNFRPHEYVLSDLILQGHLPQLLVVNMTNFHHFLLAILLDQRLFLLIDDLYNLLFYSWTFGDYFHSTSPGSKIDKSLPTGSVPAGIVVIQKVLDIFEHPEHFQSIGPSVQEKLACIKPQELLRSFLALKIITSLVIYDPHQQSPIPKPAGSKDSGQVPELHKKSPEKNALPRIAIYKMYYIMCRKLMQKYGTESISAENKQKVILGNAIFGKLIKLVYPDIKLKRLGSRGESKYNYLGMRWNDSLVSEEMKCMCDEEIPEIDSMFNPMAAQHKADGPYFPASNCDPDLWAEKGTKGLWFRSTAKKCMKHLADAGIKTLFLEPQYPPKFLLDPEWVQYNIPRDLRLLSEREPGPSLLFVLMAKAFLLFWGGSFHKQELAKWIEIVKAHTALECDATYLKFLKKLVVLAEFLQPDSQVEAEILKAALFSVISRVGTDSFRESVSQSVFRTLQAFELVETMHTELVSSITTSVCKVPDLLWTELMTEVDGPTCNAAQVVRIAIRVLHRELLVCPWATELPIRVVVEMFSVLTTMGQKAVYEMNKGLAVFRPWSLLAFATQQYMMVVSEIISLGQKAKA